MAGDGSSEHSAFKDFIASIATIKGDLSNITAPPFVLADKSTTEFPRYWISHPELFVAPAHETSPERRILAVLKWFLSSLRGQQYAGREPGQGTKKPLNAFLGEIFTGDCGPDDEDRTRLVAEQVSHHPPVTACYLWNDRHGVRAEGYTRQEITFSGSVNIRQIGHAVLHVDAYDEDYLIPLPDVKVKGILTGSPYPELHGSYAIVASSGYVAEVDFSGKGMLGFGGEKNHVEAAVYGPEHGDDGHGTRKKEEEALFTAHGTWSEKFEITDVASSRVIDTFDAASAPAADFRTRPLDEQDPWESRRAWRKVLEALRAGDMQAVADGKTELEQAQRALRTRPDTGEEAWRPFFFTKADASPVAERLLAVVGATLEAENTCGVWRFDAERAATAERPWRGELTPFG